MSDYNTPTIKVLCIECGKERKVKTVSSPEYYQERSPRCVRCGKLEMWRKRREELGIGWYSNGPNGYLWGYRSDHPLKTKHGRILQHWYVMYEHDPEFATWAKENNWTIHHKDGDRTNNNLYNLEWRAPGKHPKGWTLSDMAEALRKAGYEVE